MNGKLIALLTKRHKRINIIGSPETHDRAVNTHLDAIVPIYNTIG